jgi:hypothetical protein
MLYTLQLLLAVSNAFTCTSYVEKRMIQRIFYVFFTVDWEREMVCGVECEINVQSCNHEAHELIVAAGRINSNSIEFKLKIH